MAELGKKKIGRFFFLKDCRKIGFEIFRALVDARDVHATYCTEMRFASFLSGGFITTIVVNPPERKLAKRTSVHCAAGFWVETCSKSHGRNMSNFLID